MRGIKLNPKERKAQVAALAAAGLSQRQISKKLAISLSTIKRDYADFKPVLRETRDLLNDYSALFEKIYPVHESAEDYRQQAKNAKNEAVRLAARQRIDDLRGVVTQKELVRTRRDEASQPTALFVLPANVNLNITTVRDIERADTKVIDVSVNDITNKQDG